MHFASFINTIFSFKKYIHSNLIIHSSFRNFTLSREFLFVDSRIIWGKEYKVTMGREEKYKVPMGRKELPCDKSHKKHLKEYN